MSESLENRNSFASTDAIENPALLENTTVSRPLSTLRRLVRQRSASANVERCELCSAPLPGEHQHLIEPATRRLVCACDACALLFDQPVGGRYRRVPRRGRLLPDFVITDDQWDSLLVPINMAFFFFNTPTGKIGALYPSPAGATESLLSLDAWDGIVQANPVLRTMEHDVEALLADRLGPMRGFAAPEYYLAPIDACFQLVGLIRTHWRGLSGGTEVWQHLTQFFGELKGRCDKPSVEPQANYSGYAKDPSMPDLNFAVENVLADLDAAAPLLMLRVALTCADPAIEVQNVALRCQVQIEATRRRYLPDEQARLVDLFGEPDRWSRTLRTLLWTHASAVVPSFTGATSVDLPVPCTFDFNVAATKYFHSLEHGEIPLSLQFSGTIFYAAPDGRLQVAQIPWDKEANYRLPVAVWQEMMSIFYPNGAWLRLRKDIFERLLEYKAQHGIPTWEATIESLLAASPQRVST